MIKTVGELNSLIYQKAAIDKIPVSGTFELTARCTLHCKMCYVCDPAEAKAKELTAEQWIELGRQARDAGMFYLLITGGEPLMRADYKEIHKGLQDLGLMLTINSNGTTITEEMADFLAEHPPLRMSITLYGANPETYKRLTGHAEGFQMARDGFERLKKRGIPCRLRTVLMPDLADDINDIARYIVDQGLPVGLVNYIMPGREDNGNEQAKVRYSAEESAKAEADLNAFLRELAEERRKNMPEPEKKDDKPEKEGEKKDEIDKLADSMLETEEDEIDQVPVVPEKESAFRCSSGKYAFWVTYDGLVTPCAMLREPAVDIGKGKPFDEAWQEIIDGCAAVPTCADCESCEDRKFCVVCPARLLVETGSFAKKAEYLCAKARILRETVEARQAAEEK